VSCLVVVSVLSFSSVHWLKRRVWAHALSEEMHRVPPITPSSQTRQKKMTSLRISQHGERSKMTLNINTSRHSLPLSHPIYIYPIYLARFLASAKS
jgi:hypothetical protein